MVGLFLQSGYARLPSQPHHRVSSRLTRNLTLFVARQRIEIGVGTNVYHTPWADLIKAAKASLACWNVDTQVIWERFLAFNRSRGNAVVPAGFLLGFMRRWSSSLPPAAKTHAAEPVSLRFVEPKVQQLHDQIRAAPSSNRQFHASDLCRLIGQAAYDARVLNVVRQFGCPRFAAILAMHGRAVLAGEISR